MADDRLRELARAVQEGKKGALAAYCLEQLRLGLTTEEAIFGLAAEKLFADSSEADMREGTADVAFVLFPNVLPLGGLVARRRAADRVGRARPRVERLRGPVREGSVG